MSDYEIYSGDTKRIRVPVYEESGTPVNLANADEITFTISEWAGGPSLVTKRLSTDGINLYIAADAGGVYNGLEAIIEAGELVARGGEYYYRARVSIPTQTEDPTVIDTVRSGTLTVLDVPST
jgi:hypothetical protein